VGAPPDLPAAGIASEAGGSLVGGSRNLGPGRLPVGRDAVIEKRLTKAGFQVKAVPAKLYAQARRATYMIYLADKPAEGQERKASR